MEPELQGGRTRDSPGLLCGRSGHHMPSGTARPHRAEEGRCFLPWGIPGGGRWGGEEAEMFSSAFRYIFAP